MVPCSKLFRAGRQGEMVTGGGREGEFKDTPDIMKDYCTLPCNQASGRAPLALRWGGFVPIVQKQ